MPLHHIEKLIAKAILDYQMIQGGDRILIGASGGKDSTTLAWSLSRRRKWQRPPFEVAALRVATDVPGGQLPAEAVRYIENLYEEWGIPLVTVEIPVMALVKPGQTMNCYWCSTLRRTELLKYALGYGFNKIALGHHLDDILTTLLMNMTKKGELGTMPPRLHYEKYPIEIIRPLALVTEEQIRSFATEMGWAKYTCSCAWGGDKERKDYQRRLEVLTGGNREAKYLMLRSLSRIKEGYLA
ncbi:MAG: tRNA 2-thiocytidine biosynthesis TtcA family protein [Treponemataceae bacterium]|nr:tRNA 2-thiocytidine biosynthesis TtcA family protein [Treponemataceae bacterium]